MPTSPIPAMNLSAVATTGSKATTGNNTFPTIDTIAEARNTRRVGSLSVSGNTRSADRAYPARYAEKMTPAVVLLIPHSLWIIGRAAT